MYKQAVILLAAQALVVVAAGAVCPDREVCEETHTCCQGPNGEYSCCPHHQGECCNDHLHCCPENMVCQTEEGKSGCVNATHSLPWADRIPPQQNSLLKSLRVISASPENKDAVVCPDKSFCPSEFSCVRLPLSYGCCPIAEGVVCADGKHCCPADMQCSSDGKSCIQPQEPVSAVICSDGISECPQGASCCQSSDGVWGCCPFPKAVCCDDKEHCCPEHSICDVASSKCISESNQHMPMWAKFPARLRADWENQNPQLPSKGNDVPCDDTSACPDDNTCCKTAEGKWACCPLPKAVCCPDHEHCCPEGTTCGPDTCLSPQGPVPMLTKMAALVLPPKPNDVPCDDTSACPDDNTCCKTAEGQWACCPLPKAVCCPDHEHCCPEGTTCGPDTCLSPQGPVPMLTKMAALVKLPAVPSPPKPNDVPCDDTSACPDDNTCCKTAEGGWACCPLPKAVCCDDHIHCCPHGSTCNLPAQTCDSAEGSVPMLSKLPVQGQGSRNMPILPDEFSMTPPTMSQCDHTSSCPHRTTCCFMEKEKTWGCCPFPNALCCKDGEHCCPQGYQCDMDATTCTKGEVTIPWYNKMAAHSTPPIAAETCNATSQCSADSSCCQLSDGKMGCCPLTEAVCCADQAHCCPRGYSCNLEADSCQRSVSFQAQMLPLIRVVEQEPVKKQEEPEKQEQEKKEEPEKKQKQEQEKEEPEKEEKKPEQEQEKKEEQVPPPSLQLAPEDTAGVICDELTSCQEGETCCRAEEGWGCCPAPNAICCVDKKHCCPAGYTCSTGGVCIQLTRFHKDHWQVFFSKKKRALHY